MDEGTFRRVVVPSLGEMLGYIPSEIELVDTDTVIVQVDPTFEVMSLLSKAFGTTNINARTTRQNIGGCDTCDFSYDVGYVFVNEITTWPGVKAVLP